MTTSSVGTVFTTLTADIGSILTANIPLVFAIVAALIGLGFLVRLVKRHIGRRV